MCLSARNEPQILGLSNYNWFFKHLVVLFFPFLFKWIMLCGIRKTWRLAFFLLEIRGEEKNHPFRENNRWPSCTNVPPFSDSPLQCSLWLPPTPCPWPWFLLIWPTVPFSLLVAWPVLQGSPSTTSPSITSEDSPSQATVIAGEGKGSSSVLLISVSASSIRTSSSILFIEFRQLLTYFLNRLK